MKVVFSAGAKDDLLEISIYIAQDNPLRALSFVDELEGKCLALSNAPASGVLRAELGEGIRMVTHGRYLIFYRANESAIRIERIMHSARDIDSDDLEIS
jgi:toxin ParE1/3/4